MNSFRFSPLFAILLVVLSFSGIKAQAQMFGSSHSIDNTTYTYDSSTDDGTYQTDVYTDGNSGSLTLRGRIGATVTLAEVSGAYDGFLDGSGFHPLTVASPPISIDFPSPNGRHYNQRFDRTVWTVDLANDNVYVSERTIYSGNFGEFSIPAGGADGEVSGSEGGHVFQEQLYLNYSSSTTWQPGTGTSVVLFGSTYRPVTSTSSTNYDSMGNASSSSQTAYQSIGNGSFSYVEWSNLDANGIPESGATMSGNDPHVGNWTATGSPNAPVFDPLESARFLPDTFWVNGTVVNWSETTITSATGNISSIFTADGITVTVTGNARAYSLDNTPVSIVVSVGGQAYSGSKSPSGPLSGFTPSVCDVQLSDPNRNTPLFTVSTLYVDGVPFVFAGGYEDSAGSRTDRYEHDGALLRLTGSTSTPSAATVQIDTDTGTFSSGAFTVPGCVILTTLVDVPPAFWIHGTLYTKLPSSTAYVSAAIPPQSFVVSGEQVNDLTLLGTLSGVPLTGAYNGEIGGVFNVTLGGVSRLACPADTNGALRQGPSLATLCDNGGPHPEFADLPAAVRIPVADGPQPHAALDFLGLVTDDDTTGDLVACYGYAQVPASDPANYWKQNLFFLKIHPDVSPSKKVTLRDYKAAKTSDGTYNVSSRLFQTNLRASDSTIEALPQPVMSLLRPSYEFWFIDAPAGGLPRSFIIRGQPWWYAGEVGGQPTYRGFYSGQQMSLGTIDAGGQRLVTLNDYNLNDDGSLNMASAVISNGTLNGTRSSVRFRNGTLALSGTDAGIQQTISIEDDFSLHTIRSDVDIVGNNISFGVLENDASFAGTLFQFSDRLEASVRISRLRSILSRANAEWSWEKALDEQSAAAVPVMKLDQFQQLNIYPQGDSSQPGVFLSPDATSLSRIKSSLLVSENLSVNKDLIVAGNLALGGAGSSSSITLNDQPVLTMDTADSRYLKAIGDTPITINTGATFTTGGISTAPSALATFNGALTANSAATFTGSAAFASGANITGTTQVTGALNNTGNFTTTGTARFKQAVTVESDLIIRGKYEGPTENRKVVSQPEQEILIPESGDISMGEFRQGPLPETVPE